VTPISATELSAWLGDAARVPPQVLDVRETWELDRARIAGVVHVPMGQLPGALDALDPLQPVVCLCHHGARSAQVALFLDHHGFASVFNLSGGIDAWSREVDPTVPLY
jgi:rhodanese-related sulfurtransferase